MGTPKNTVQSRRSGRVVLEEDSEVSRLIIAAIGTFVLRLDRERRAAYFADLDLATVMDVVGLAGVEAQLRDPAFREKHKSFSSVIGIEGQRGINALSIAETTGMPRETVRRKLKQLVELNAIVEKSRGSYVLRPGVMQEPARQKTFARGVREVLRFINQLLEQNLVRWEPSETGD